MKKTLRIGRLIFVLSAISLLIISCAPAQETTAPEEPQETMAPTDEPASEEPTEEEEEEVTAPMNVEVAMQGNTFQPAEITVAVGGTVTWTNEDSVSHTVTAGTRGNPTGAFDESVGAGDSFSYTFEEPGVVEYYCSIHPGMDGTVIVGE